MCPFPAKGTHAIGHLPNFLLVWVAQRELRVAPGGDALAIAGGQSAHTRTLPLTVLTSTLATQANWFMDNINYHVAH